MKHRFIEITSKKIKVYDAETTINELIYEFAINFVYAFAANIITPFIIMKSDAGILISFMGYYYLLSYILNRDKYTTKLGRYMIMPSACVIGAYSAIKIGYLIANYL